MVSAVEITATAVHIHTYTHTADPVALSHFDDNSVRVNYARYKAKKIYERQALYSEYSMTKPSRKQ